MYKKRLPASTEFKSDLKSDSTKSSSSISSSGTESFKCKKAPTSVLERLYKNSASERKKNINFYRYMV